MTDPKHPSGGGSYVRDDKGKLTRAEAPTRSGPPPKAEKAPVKPAKKEA